MKIHQMICCLIIICCLFACNKKEVAVPELIGIWRLDSLSYEGKILKNMDVEKDTQYKGQFINLDFEDNKIASISYHPDYYGNYKTFTNNGISLQVHTSSNFLGGIAESEWSPYFVTIINIISKYEIMNSNLILCSPNSKLFFTKKS